MKYNLIPMRLAIIKKIDNNIGEDVETRTIYHQWECKIVQPL